MPILAKKAPQSAVDRTVDRQEGIFRQPGSLWRRVIEKYAILLGFLVVCIILSFLCPNFLTVANILNVLRQVSITGIMAIGATFVILTGGIDLSVGSVLALAGILAAGLQVNHQAGILASVFLPLLVTGLLGAVIGVVITQCKVAPFVMTLGVMSIARGATLVYSNGYPISGLSKGFRFIGGGWLGQIPFPVIIYILVAAAGSIILAKTRFGRHVYAIGGNQEAARLSGVLVERTKILIYAISSLAAGLAGIILASRLNSGEPVAGIGQELDVIASVVIGGTSLMGGEGGIFGTVVGSLLIGVLNNGLNLLNVSSFYQQIVKGFIIVIAVIFDQVRRDRG